MLTLPTVRVANPLAPGTFMTINATDLLPSHTVWPEQAEGYVPFKLGPVACVLDPAVRDRAAAMMVGMVTARLEMVGDTWADLSGEAQLAALADAEADCADLLAIRQVRRASDLAEDGDEGLGPSIPAVEVVEARTGALSVAKGPGGRWYVTRDGVRIAPGYALETDARSAMLTAG